MALALSNLGNGESGSTETSHVATVTTPSAGSLVAVAWSMRASDGSSQVGETPTISGLSGSWTQRSTTRVFSGTAALMGQCFTGTSAGWSGTTVTMSTVSSKSMNRFQWAVVQITGHDTGTPVVQIVGASGSSGTLAPSLSAFGSANNIALLFGLSTGLDDPTWTIESSYTRLTSTGAVNRYAAYLANDTSPTVTYTATTAPVEGFGLEIAEAGGGGGATQWGHQLDYTWNRIVVP